MFSETRYALNGDLRVAYRASREGPRDIVSVPNWFTCCEVLPELPSIQGWVEAMTSLGRLIYFDQPGTGASDPVTPGALPTLEQWADSITAALDALGSREAVLVASNSAFAPAALFAATHPSRTSALVVLDGYADAGGTPLVQGKTLAARVRMWGTGEIYTCDESGHAVERGDPGSVGSDGTPGGEPSDRCTHDASRDGSGRAGGPSDSSCADSCRPALRRRDRAAAKGKYIAEHIPRREIR
jgi:pimeloyl-ACP methyl ester carboxylesterase